MRITEVFKMFHRAVARVVLGKRNVALDKACKEKSSARRKMLTKKVEALESRTQALCDAVGVEAGN